MTELELYDWQNRLINIVEDGEASSVMIVAPTQAGKTTALDVLKENEDTEYVTMRGGPDIPELDDRHDGNTLLIDEGGMEPNARGLLDVIEAHEEPTVLTSLPGVPSTAMLQPMFDVVIEVDDE